MHEFFGLYSDPQCYAGTITAVVTYVFFRLNLGLPLNKFRRQCYKFRRQCYKFRRQCYDGVGNMSGQRTCVAKRIQKLEPGQSNHILKATRFIGIPGDSGRIGVRTMCHTRWTIKVDALGSITSNCTVLRSTPDDAKDVDRARYGDEGRNSRHFVSNEQIPLPVRDQIGRTNAETRQQLELKFRCCDSIWSDGYLSRERVSLLSVTQPGTAVALLQFIIVIPARNATSERLFTVLRHLKSYLRTTMLQEHLNYLMLLHVHTE